jgi:hypothetical protein
VRAYRQFATSHPGEETAVSPALGGCIASLPLLSLPPLDTMLILGPTVQLRACGMADANIVAW